MESADATVAQAREQIKSLEADLVGLRGALDSVGSGTLGGIRDDAVQADAALKGVRDSALEAGAAARNISTDSAANARAELLAKEYDGIRDTLIEIRAIQTGTGASDVAIAKTDVQVAQVASLRDKWIEAAAAAKGAGPTDTEIAKQALMAAEAEKTRDALVEAAVAAHGGGGGGSVAGAAARDAGGGNNRGFLTGFLPGGQRASAATVTGLIGLGLSTGPVVAPAAVGAAAGAAAGLTSLLGAALTLKLAFADITSAAFTSQKAFDALNPVQQDFVQGLRNIDYQFVRPLEELASQNVLPGLTAALKDAITPASTGVARQAVTQFGQAIAGGAQQLGGLFGSVDFAKQLAPVVQADAGYIRDLLSGVTSLVDAFVRLENAAIPLTNWLDKGALAFANWIDDSVKAAQASGQLAGYFDKAKAAIEGIGSLVGSVGSAFGALFGAIGFESSLGVLNLFRSVFDDLANLINQNKQVLHDFFAGAVQSAQDILNVIRTMTTALRPLLTTLNTVANLIGGWRVVIDAAAAAITLKLIPGFLAVGPAAETGAAESGILFTTISAGAETALASVSLLRTALLGVLLLPTAYQFGKQLGGALFGTGDNAAYLAQLAAQSALAPGQFVNAKGQIIGKNGKPTGQIVLPSGDQTSSTINTNLPPNISAAITRAIQDHSKVALAKADAEARAYYKGQEAYASTPDDLTTLQGYIQEYTPGGTTPPGLGNTRTTVLPVALQTGIDKATSNVAAGGSTAPEITAINNALAYINGLKKPTDADYQERTTLYNLLKSAQTGGATAVPTGTATLPAGLQTSLANAQAAAAGQSAVSGTFNAQNLQAQRALREQDLAGFKALNTEIAKQAAGSKELRALDAERLTLRHEALAAEKQITEELKNQKEAIASAKIDKILGISSAGPTSPGATALGSRERQILLEDAKRHGVETQALINEPLAQLVKTLAGDNALPKSSQAALLKINNAIHEALVTGTKLNSTQSQQIQALLTQIDDTLKNSLGYGSNYRAPSAQALAEQVPGYDKLSHDQKVALIAGFAAKVGHHGTIQTGGAVGGVPLGPNGEPLTTPPGYAQTTAPGAPPHAVSHSQFGQGVTFGDVTIIIDGSKGNAKEIAAEVRSELLKTARRNPLQTKGPNAGRRLALN